MHFRLRPARERDLQHLLIIEQEVFPAEPFSRRQFRDMLRSARTRVVLATCRGLPAGFVVVWWRLGSSTCRIIDIAVRRPFRRRGLARRLVEAALRLGRADGFVGVTLEVEESNRPARALYRACGFVDDRRLPHYYESGRHAIRMVRWLPPGSRTGRPRQAAVR